MKKSMASTEIEVIKDAFDMRILRKYLIAFCVRLYFNDAFIPLMFFPRLVWLKIVAAASGIVLRVPFMVDTHP